MKKVSDVTFKKIDDLLKPSIINANSIVKSYDGTEFEQFILEWLKYCQHNNNPDIVIGRVGGKGDYGLDVFLNDNGKTSYIQCKNYSKSLSKVDFIEIILKVMWYVNANTISKPDKLIVIGASGYSQNVLDMLSSNVLFIKDINMSTDDLTKALGKITKKKLTTTQISDFKIFIAKISDWSFVSKIDLDDVVKEFCTSEYCVMRFTSSIYTKISKVEIEQEEFTRTKFYKQLDKIITKRKKNALINAKDSYYSALQLLETNRYLFGNDEEFKLLEKEVMDFIEPKRMKNYDSLQSRYSDIISRAQETPVDNNYLSYGLHLTTVSDKVGICHINVNSGNLSWEEEDE